MRPRSAKVRIRNYDYCSHVKPREYWDVNRNHSHPLFQNIGTPKWCKKPRRWELYKIWAVYHTFYEVGLGVVWLSIGSVKGKHVAGMIGSHLSKSQSLCCNLMSDILEPATFGWKIGHLVPYKNPPRLPPGISVLGPNLVAKEWVCLKMGIPRN
jgi:hypothetical protein